MFRKENVKLRHAAVMALMGWCLLAPPVGSLRSTRNPSTGFYDAYSTLPFGAWEIAESYETAAECRAALDKANQLAKQSCPDCSVIEVCIATNDPRLRGK